MNKFIKTDNKTKNDKKMRQMRPVPSVLDLIYPPTCGICGKLSQEFLCKKCNKLLEQQAKFIVQRHECLGDEVEVNFEELLYVFKYEGIIRKMLLNYKFQDKSYLYKTFVNFLLKNKKVFEKITEYDIIVPVPISKKRKKERGYNQSLLIAKEISMQISYETNNNIKLELVNNCLIKTKNIIEQSKLNKEDRQHNIQGVYTLKNGSILTNKSILLIDDIYTTGSTVNECCKIINEAKPNKIGVLTIAKD